MSLNSYITINDKPVIDPVALSRDAILNRVSNEEWAGIANAVHVPRGRHPTVAKLLLTYDVMEYVGEAAATIKLVFGAKDTDVDKTLPGAETQGSNVYHPGKRTVTIGDMRLFSRTAVLAPSTEHSSAFLCEFRGPRQIATMSAIDKAYNCPTPYFHDANPPTIPTDDYWYSTTNTGGVAWTWQQMLDDIWGHIAIFSASPDYSLASLPTKDPQGYRFNGWSAWDAFNTALEDIGHYLAPGFLLKESGGDPDWYVVHEGSNPPSAQDDALEGARKVPTSMSHPKAVGSRVPEKVTVMFPARRYDYPFDGDNNVVHCRDSFDSSPTHTISVNTSAPGAVSGTEVMLRDTMEAYYNSATGALLNNTDLTTRATKLKDGYLAKVEGADADDVFSGLHLISPMAEVDETIFFDFGLGWQTKIDTKWSGIAESGPRSPYHHAEEVKQALPWHRSCVVTIAAVVGSGGTTLEPGAIGKGSVMWWDLANSPLPWWKPFTPARYVYFYNAGVDAIDFSSTTYAYLEYWWQARAFITFCGFTASS